MKNPFKRKKCLQGQINEVTELILGVKKSLLKDINESQNQIAALQLQINHINQKITELKNPKFKINSQIGKYIINDFNKSLDKYVMSELENPEYKFLATEQEIDVLINKLK